MCNLLKIHHKETPCFVDLISTCVKINLLGKQAFRLRENDFEIGGKDL